MYREPTYQTDSDRLTIQYTENPTILRKSLIAFIRNLADKNENAIFRELKDNYLTVLLERNPGTDKDILWREYLVNQEIVGNWAEDLTIRLLPWLVKRPLLIVDLVQKQQYTIQSENVSNKEPLRIGTIAQTHFQSLLPVEQCLQSVRCMGCSGYCLNILRHISLKESCRELYNVQVLKEAQRNIRRAYQKEYKRNKRSKKDNNENDGNADSREEELNNLSEAYSTAAKKRKLCDLKNHDNETNSILTECKGCHKSFKIILKHLQYNKVCAAYYEKESNSTIVLNTNGNKLCEGSFIQTVITDTSMLLNTTCIGCQKHFKHLSKHLYASQNCKNFYNFDIIEKGNKSMSSKKKDVKNVLGNGNSVNIIRKSNNEMSYEDSINAFYLDCIWGAKYPCICCHKRLFRESVKIVNMGQLESLPTFKLSTLNIFKENALFKVYNEYWICRTCYYYLSEKRIPVQSVGNCLQVFDRPSCLNLTEIENTLIAPQIPFMKILKLPKSRMNSLIDKIVNIPILDGTLQKNFATLPRTSNEADLIPVAIKRKKVYNTNYLANLVNPHKIRQAVQFLQSIYPPYKSIKFNFDKLNSNYGEKMEENSSDDSSSDIDDEDIETLESYLNDDLDMDNIKKYQTKISSSELLHPQNLASKVNFELKNESSNSKKSPYIFNPGEDQKPMSILADKNLFVN